MNTEYIKGKNACARWCIRINYLSVVISSGWACLGPYMSHDMMKWRSCYTNDDDRATVEIKKRATQLVNKISAPFNSLFSSAARRDPQGDWVASLPPFALYTQSCCTQAVFLLLLNFLVKTLFAQDSPWILFARQTREKRDAFGSVSQTSRQISTRELQSLCFFSTQQSPCCARIHFTERNVEQSQKSQSQSLND